MTPPGGPSPRTEWHLALFGVTGVLSLMAAMARFTEGKGGFLLVAPLAMAGFSLIVAVLLWFTPPPSR